MKTTTNLLLLTLLASGLSGCMTSGGATGFGGSDTGNPDSVVNDAIGPKLSIAACETLQFCTSGFDRRTCESAGLNLSDVAPHLGLGTKNTLNDIDSAIAFGSAEASRDNLNTCLSHINNVRCADLPIKDIWDSKYPSDYRGLVKFWESVKHVCGNVVRPKP